MEIRIKYFGSMAEAAGKAEELIALDVNDLNVEDIRTICFKKYGLSEDPTVRLAVNQVICDDGKVQDGDEIAFLPPYAGG